MATVVVLNILVFEARVGCLKKKLVAVILIFVVET